MARLPYGRVKAMRKTTLLIGLLLLVPLATSVQTTSLRDTNRTQLLSQLPSFNPFDTAYVYQNAAPGAAPTVMSASQALEAYLTFLDGEKIDLRKTAGVVPDWPMVNRVRVTESGDIRYSQPGQTLGCPSVQNMPDPVPTAFSTVWTATYPNVPSDVASTLLIPASTAQAVKLVSRVSYHVNPTSQGASATEFTPGDDPNDDVVLQRTIRYKAQEITMGPIMSYNCSYTKNFEGKVATVFFTATVNGLVHNQPW